MIRSTTRIGARVGVCFLIATLSSSVACDDTSDDAADSATGETAAAEDTTGDGDGDSGDGDGDGALSYAADIQPIWDANCVNGCHVAGGVAQLFVHLDAPDSYSNIVGTLSTQAPALQLIKANDSANSYLIAKLRGTQVAAGGSGGPMPGGVNPIPLPEETIMMIEAWVDSGVLP